MSRTSASPPTAGSEVSAVPAGSDVSAVKADSALTHGLKQRHLSMIALGGVIGAGLFVGSGAGIAAAGPSIVIAYAISGLLVMFVMRMLGEMSAANPASGSFSVHAERAIGPWAGFTAGWAFWVLLCVAVGLEGIGAAKIVHRLAARHSRVGVGGAVHGGLLRHEPGRRQELRRVRVLVRRAEGRRDHALPGAGRAGHPRGAARHGRPGRRQPPRRRRLPAERRRRASSSDCSPPSSRTAVWRRSPSPRPSPRTRCGASPRRSGRRCGGSRSFYVGSMAVIVTLVPWDDPEVATVGPYVATLDHLGIPRRRGRS